MSIKLIDEGLTPLPKLLGRKINDETKWRNIIEFPRSGHYEIIKSIHNLNKQMRSIKDEPGKEERHLTSKTNQQKAFKILVQHLENPSDPLRVIISGTAGTGKSFLIDSMISMIEQKGKGVKVTAFTGVAANNIHGEAIHSLFQRSLSNW